MTDVGAILGWTSHGGGSKRRVRSVGYNCSYSSISLLCSCTGERCSYVVRFDSPRRGLHLISHEPLLRHHASAIDFPIGRAMITAPVDAKPIGGQCRSRLVLCSRCIQGLQGWSSLSYPWKAEACEPSRSGPWEKTPSHRERGLYLSPDETGADLGTRAI